jgi:hypothetical protein
VSSRADFFPLSKSIAAAGDSRPYMSAHVVARVLTRRFLSVSKSIAAAGDSRPYTSAGVVVRVLTAQISFCFEVDRCGW